jgi:HAD superfamily hydrolase (TIGR01484 family)
MKEHRGWIALDIDGTITDQIHHVPNEVHCYLKSLCEQGWEIALITGRPFSFAHTVLQAFDFPYFLAVQNGADIFHMPTQKLVSRTYLSGEAVTLLEEIYTGYEEDFLIYAGYQKGDFCYYRPARFTAALQSHLEKIQAISPEPWKAVESFEFARQETFPLIKCLGSEQFMQEVHTALSPIEGVLSTLIRDPLTTGIFLNLVTDRRANKGSALERIIEQTGKRGTLIAAGDDRNDISMLKVATFKIVMQTAPIDMHALADILAPSAADLGIIRALKEATTC